MGDAIRWAAKFGINTRWPGPIRRVPITVLCRVYELRYRLTGRLD